MFKKIALVLLSIVIIAGIAGAISYKLFYKKVEGVTDINSKIISTPTQTPEPQPTKEPTQQATSKPKPIYQPTSEPTPEPTNTQNTPSNSQNQTDYNNCIQKVSDDYYKAATELSRNFAKYIEECPNAACREEETTLLNNAMAGLDTIDRNEMAKCAAQYPH